MVARFKCAVQVDACDGLRMRPGFALQVGCRCASAPGSRRYREVAIEDDAELRFDFGPRRQSGKTLLRGWIGDVAAAARFHSMKASPRSEGLVLELKLYERAELSFVSFVEA